MAEAVPAEEVAAEAAPAAQAPETMPITGADGGQAGAVVVLLLVAALAGVVLFGRRQTA